LAVGQNTKNLPQNVVRFIKRKERSLGRNIFLEIGVLPTQNANFARHVRRKQKQGKGTYCVLSLFILLLRLSVAGDQSQCSPVPPTSTQPKDRNSEGRDPLQWNFNTPPSLD
jgi:hypothetical protein